MGSSYLPGELIAAFLWAQLEDADRITAQRLAAWQRYHRLLEPLEESGALRRPIVPVGEHNGHMYYILLSSGIDRQQVLEKLKQHQILALFHYVPPHSSPAGLRYGRAHGELTVTNSISERLIRLPLWMGISEEQQNRLVRVLSEVVA
jgi:dTDP-4-amino-4,6-dideoxygalactose transaminase